MVWIAYFCRELERFKLAKMLYSPGCFVGLSSKLAFKVFEKRVKAVFGEKGYSSGENGQCRPEQNQSAGVFIEYANTINEIMRRSLHGHAMFIFLKNAEKCLITVKVAMFAGSRTSYLHNAVYSS